MKRTKKLFPLFAGVITVVIVMTVISSPFIPVFSQIQSGQKPYTVIIDAGHGGVDGGATSCTVVLESQLNLEIALRLEELMHLLGYDTVMIRRSDISVYTEGETIAAKKVSDLKQRVKVVNGTEGGILVSIHQNQFSDSRYSGAQVFYAKGEESKSLATKLQSAFVGSLNPGSRRKAKQASGVYLMEKITNPGVLIECGFLSNLKEEALLRESQYQRNYAR